MRVLVVRIGNMNAYPPSVSLINALHDLGHEVIIITTKDSVGVEKSIPEGIKVEYINLIYLETSLTRRIINKNTIKSKLLQLIKKYYTNDSVVWLEDDATIKHVVYDIENYNYVIRLDELNEELYMTQHFRYKLLSLDASRIGNNALAVVMPEYNRAQMTKVWWKLEKMPYVLPNKPYVSDSIDLSNKKYEFENSICKVIDEIGDKKIVLYQGKMHPERPVEPFIEAVQDLDDFVFVVNARSSEGVEKRYRNCYHIGFISPPFHLQVTQMAHIGIVAYIPGIGTDSVLNALYCAPNKIFEYGSFGVPFISNDLPPLRNLFDKYECGTIVDINDPDNIRDMILQIDRHYDFYSQNVKTMNDSVDYKKLVENLMDEVVARIGNRK
jgi:hypothetical protein